MESYTHSMMQASSLTFGETRIISDNARATLLGYLTNALEISEPTEMLPIIDCRNQRRLSSVSNGATCNRCHNEMYDDAAPSMPPSRRCQIYRDAPPVDGDTTPTTNTSFSSQGRLVSSNRLPSFLRQLPYDVSSPSARPGNGSFSSAI
jgi:hypothetical protein